MTFNAVYVLPFKGNRLVTGWQLSGIESWHTGVPFTVLSYNGRDGMEKKLRHVTAKYHRRV